MNGSFETAFRAAIDAVHSGDAGALARLLDAEPRLLHERLLESDTSEVSPWPTYFRNPKLLWFVANNPILVRPMPANMVEIANTMIARGVETADLEYTLELVMTGSAAREAGLQRALARRLRDAGAVVTPHVMLAAAAHRETDILRMFVEDGAPMDAVLAAALGDVDTLRALLVRADERELHAAFAVAVINGCVACARLILDAGADIDAFFPAGAHPHATALHQAAANDDAPMIELLLARGANRRQRDAHYDGTPLDWAIHESKPAARALLEPA